MKRRRGMLKPSAHLLKAFARVDAKAVSRPEPFEMFPCMTMRLTMLRVARGESRYPES